MNEPQTHTCIHGTCSNCSVQGQCLPAAVGTDNIAALEQIIQRRRAIGSGEHLYRCGEEFRHIYAIRSGSLKTYLIDEEGTEQVTGFYFAGDMLGFDGLDPEIHSCNVVSLEAATVCEISIDSLEELALDLPALQHHFFRLMGEEIGKDHRMMLALGKKNAESRIASLLVTMSRRNETANLPPDSIHLPMSRMDIGNFLGMTIETVSRTLGRLHRDQVISIDGRDVNIRNLPQLIELSETC